MPGGPEGGAVFAPEVYFTEFRATIGLLIPKCVGTARFVS